MQQFSVFNGPNHLDQKPDAKTFRWWSWSQ